MNLYPGHIFLSFINCAIYAFLITHTYTPSPKFSPLYMVIFDILMSFYPFFLFFLLKSVTSLFPDFSGFIFTPLDLFSATFTYRTHDYASLFSIVSLLIFFFSVVCVLVFLMKLHLSKCSFSVFF